VESISIELLEGMTSWENFPSDEKGVIKVMGAFTKSIRGGVEYLRISRRVWMVFKKVGG
jgi:hypothetical protein